MSKELPSLYSMQFTDEAEIESDRIITVIAPTYSAYWLTPQERAKDIDIFADGIDCQRRFTWRERLFDKLSKQYPDATIFIHFTTVDETIITFYPSELEQAEALALDVARIAAQANPREEADDDTH